MSRSTQETQKHQKKVKLVTTAPMFISFCQGRCECNARFVSEATFGKGTLKRQLQWGGNAGLLLNVRLIEADYGSQNKVYQLVAITWT